MTPEQQTELIYLIDKYSKDEGIHETAIPDVRCFKMFEPGNRMPVVYKPSFCFIVQGKKQVVLEDEIYQYEPSQYLAVSVDLPMLGEVTIASPEEPYLCLAIDLNSRLLSEILTQFNPFEKLSSEPVRGLFVGKSDKMFTDSVLRLARLLDTPQDIPLLTPMVIKEIYYRLLQSPHGQSIAQLAVAGSKMQRIATVIQYMQNDFAQAIRVEEMAQQVNMSPSSFHSHFKSVTAMSPLQYLKRLRLMEARRILLSEDMDAASTAYRVGYESPSQFSREYARMFGCPPMTDVANLRKSLKVQSIL